MSKKTALQALLVFIVFIIFLSFYLKYFNEEKKVLENKPTEEKVDNKNSSSTYIDNIDYVSIDAKGNEYQVTAEFGEIKIENSDIMLLTNVIAYIYIKDSDTVKITSNFGKYNSKNSDTNFSKNVIVVYPGHKITGEYLDFSFLNNLGTMSKNVFYNSNRMNLLADKIEINLTTKDTRIFMNDIDKKVLIKETK